MDYGVLISNFPSFRQKKMAAKMKQIAEINKHEIKSNQEVFVYVFKNK